MRHLLTILARAPSLFLSAGLATVALSVCIAVMCVLGPRVVFGRFALFDYHTLIFTALLGFLGAQLFGTGLVLHMRQPLPLRGIAARLLGLNEGILFWLFAVVGAARDESLSRSSSEAGVEQRTSGGTRRPEGALWQPRVPTSQPRGRSPSP